MSYVALFAVSKLFFLSDFNGDETIGLLRLLSNVAAVAAGKGDDIGVSAVDKIRF